MGLLKVPAAASRAGLLLLALASLLGAGLALWLRRAPVLASVRPMQSSDQSADDCVKHLRAMSRAHVAASFIPFTAYRAH